MGLIDEVRDHDADQLNEIVLPLMNVNRRTKARLVNPNEPHQAQLFMTSAGTRNSFAYQKLIECLENEIINPKSTYVWGCDYRIPLMHGLLDKTYLNEIKMSTTYKDESFAREYLGKWTGGGSESWFDYDRLGRYRKIINPENSQKIGEHTNIFYLLSVDVGRLNCQTVVSVFKVYIRENNFNAALVNIYILGKEEKTKHFDVQATDLKKIIDAFKPAEVVIDANGLGVGLMDSMVKETFDPATNSFYPAYCSFNDDDYRQSLYPAATPLIYTIKANTTLDSKIHGNCYSKVYSGQVSFLAREQDIKIKLLSTQKGQKMSLEARAARIVPHELTTRLFEEMANFKLRPTGNGTDIKLEKINTRMLSDKFSSFEYGLWRIKEKEEEYFKKIRRKGGRNRKLVFYTEGR